MQIKKWHQGAMYGISIDMELREQGLITSYLQVLGLLKMINNDDDTTTMIYKMSLLATKDYLEEQLGVSTIAMIQKEFTTCH